jgi:hypothetical protein
MNATRKPLFGLAAALAVTVTIQAASPIGEWIVNNNGFGLLLSLTVDANGNVTGLANGESIKGFWNESAGKLTFHRDIGAVNLNGPVVSRDKIQVFTGYIFPCNSPSPSPQGQCLAGSFESFAGTGASASKNVFGWVAYQQTKNYP